MVRPMNRQKLKKFACICLAILCTASFILVHVAIWKDWIQGAALYFTAAFVAFWSGWLYAWALMELRKLKASAE